MIDATITPTILPLRFEWWKAVTSGTVELPSENRKKNQFSDKTGKISANKLSDISQRLSL